MNKPVILTGLRANNALHLGNYLGALLPMVQLQQRYAGDYQINLFVPDLHSFTTPIEHDALYSQIIENVKTYVAAGLDLDNPDTYVYRQSCIPAHSELTVILNCFTYMGELNRMTQYKEKAKSKQSLTVGLFDYPVLMAADILLYGALYVPVGEDQTQHVELARDIAVRMNHKFGQLFIVPKAEKDQIAFAGQQRRLRIRDLSKPHKKMSKSEISDKGIIYLHDKPKEAAKKIMSATTDSYNSINYDYNKQPGISNLLDIFSALTNQSIDVIVDQFKGDTQYGRLKSAVADEVQKFLTNIQANIAKVDESYVMSVLQNSEQAMIRVANATLLKVQKAVGLRSK